MNIHEYQAKDLFKKYGIPVPPYAVVSSVEEAEKALDELGIEGGVVKVMVHAGGRGKAGGVKIGKTKEEVLSYVKDLVGLKIVNNQTGPEGVVAHKVMISPAEDIEKQYYVGCIIDRESASAAMIVSPEGGVEIEEVAANTPEKIMTVPLYPGGVLKRYQQLNIAKFMGWEGDIAKQGMKIVASLGKLFREVDASLMEINPLILTPDGRITALDAKIGIDDNALFRHPDIEKMYDPTQVPEREARALEHDLAYIALDGNIGCMVNGAGLAMATMDIIQHYGGMPSNFLDVGGGATKEKVAEGFKIILSDPQVKAILVNIFGGIMNCVTLSAGIIAAAGELDLKVPLVVRMEGTNVDQGRAMLKDSGLNIIAAESMAEAADKVVAAARGE